MLDIDIDVVAQLGRIAGSRHRHRYAADLAAKQAVEGDLREIVIADALQDRAGLRTLQARRMDPVIVAGDAHIPALRIGIEPFFGASRAADPPEILSVEARENPVLDDSAI